MRREAENAKELVLKDFEGTSQPLPPDLSVSIDPIQKIVQQGLRLERQQHLSLEPMRNSMEVEGRDDQNETRLTESSNEVPIQDENRQGLLSSLVDLRKEVEQMKKITTSFEHGRRRTEPICAEMEAFITSSPEPPKALIQIDKRPTGTSPVADYCNSITVSPKSADVGVSETRVEVTGKEEEARAKMTHNKQGTENTAELALVRKILSDATSGMNEELNQKVVKSEAKVACLQSKVIALEAKLKCRDSTVTKLRAGMEDAEKAIDYSKTKIDQYADLHKEYKKEIIRWRGYYSDKAIRLDKVTNESNRRIQELEEQAKQYSVELINMKRESLARLEQISELSRERDELARKRDLLMEELQETREKLEHPQAPSKISGTVATRREKTLPGKEESPMKCEVANYDGRKQSEDSFDEEGDLSECSESALASAGDFASGSTSASDCDFDSFPETDDSSYPPGIFDNLLDGADRLLFHQDDLEDQNSYVESVEVLLVNSDRA